MSNIIKIISINGTREMNLDNFNKDVISFGRTDECDIQISEEYVSRLHGCFFKDSGKWFFKDMNSKHGIYFRGVKTDSSILSNNDELFIFRSSNPNEAVKIVFSTVEDQPSMPVVSANVNRFCSNCGQPLDEGDMFCAFCGTKVEGSTPPAVSIPKQQKMVGEKQASKKRKNGALGVLDFILGLIALLGFITLAVLCQEMKLDFTVLMIWIAGGVGVLGVIFFIISKKGRLAKLGFVFSLITIVLALGFIFVLIPVQENRLSKNYMEELKNCQNMDEETKQANYNKNTSDSFSAYPYRSVKDYYDKYYFKYKEVEDYLIKLYEDGKYDEWMASCYYVNKTLDGLDKYSRPSFIFDNYSTDFMDELFRNSDPVEIKGLIDCDVLFYDSPFAESEADGATITRDVIKQANDPEWAMHVTTYNPDSLHLGKHGDYLIGKYFASDTSVGYEVIDLRNGNYFYGGRWY